MGIPIRKPIEERLRIALERLGGEATSKEIREYMLEQDCPHIPTTRSIGMTLYRHPKIDSDENSTNRRTYRIRD